jgi:hypothetical protein
VLRPLFGGDGGSDGGTDGDGDGDGGHSSDLFGII